MIPHPPDAGEDVDEIVIKRCGSNQNRIDSRTRWSSRIPDSNIASQDIRYTDFIQQVQLLAILLSLSSFHQLILDNHTSPSEKKQSLIENLSKQSNKSGFYDMRIATLLIFNIPTIQSF